MNVNPDHSIYHERSDVHDEFTKDEIKHLRLILRRLRFLEKKARENGADTSSASAQFVVWEVEALAWLLEEMDYLEEVKA